MRHIVTASAFIISLSLLFSCSGMEETAQQPSQEETEVSQYPSWYPDQNIVIKKNMLYGYASAIGKDSTSSVSKAVSWAESELQSAISEKLEDIRTEAMKESGSESGLDDPKFLIALRKAENEVSTLVETNNAEVKTVEGYNTHRSFAEISVPKDQLIERIGDRLAGHEQAWNTMKQSKAFESF